MPLSLPHSEPAKHSPIPGGDLRTTEGEIMGIRHKHYLVEGVQFHPEAILTEGGKQLLRNFVQIARAFNNDLRELKHATI